MVTAGGQEIDIDNRHRGRIVLAPCNGYGAKFALFLQGFYSARMKPCSVLECVGERHDTQPFVLNKDKRATCDIYSKGCLIDENERA